jgi:hypothetical protein
MPEVAANWALLALLETGDERDRIKARSLIRVENRVMAKTTKPRIVEDEAIDPAFIQDPATTPADPAATPDEQLPPISPEDAEQLDEEEREFRAMRRDIPGVKGASAAGIVSISVAKAPLKNEFFRTHRDPHFRPLVPMVDVEIGMEKHFFAVTSEMIAPLTGIGIGVSDRVLYLTVTSRGALRFVPVRQATGDSEQNEYDRTKEIGLINAMDEWVRLFTDQENKDYKVFPAPAGRFGEPQWPDLKAAKVFRLAFRDKGRLIDSVHHPLFAKWAARDADK